MKNELKLFKVKIIAECETMTKTKVVCAKTKEEAQQIFIAWKYYEKKYHNIDYMILSIRIFRPSKIDEGYYKHFLEDGYYKKCLALLERFKNE